MRSRRKPLAVTFILIGSLLLAPAVSSAAAGPDELPKVQDLPLTVMATPSQVVHHGNPKLDTKLNSIVDALSKAPGSLQQALSSPDLLIEEQQILVEMKFNAEETQAVQAALEAAGGRFRNNNAPGLCEAWIPVSQLESIADDPAVYFVRTARLVKHYVGNSDTQGLVESNADDWHTWGITGTGMTIAVIDSFSPTVASLQASNDWPPNSQLTMVDVDGGGFGNQQSNHGMACLEIAYDMAPGANFIAYDTLTVGDWYNAIIAADAAGADIMSASLGAPLDGIGDGTAQTGSIAEAAGIAKGNGRFLVNAAGNERQQHWGGLYDDHPLAPGYHDWEGSGTLTNVNYGVWCIPNGYTIAADLFWDDWTSVNHNYDLELYEYNGSGWTLRASSTNTQNGGMGQTPQEWIRHTVSGALGQGGCPSDYGVFGVAVHKVSAATDRNLQLFTNLDELYWYVENRSLGFPADSPNVFTIAAVDVTSKAQEPYSSEGPILAPGGGIPGSPPATHKPDAASFANVDTQSYGAGVFNGTSAATPHVAGMAALVWQYNSSWTVGQLEAEMINIASDTNSPTNDLGSPGADYEYGHGLERFHFLPNALTLASFTASSGMETLTFTWYLVPVALGLLLVTLGVLLIQRRKYAP